MIDELEYAVLCFERWSRTEVTFYEYDVRLSSIFPHNRCIHQSGYCSLVKAAGNENRCHNFDRRRLLVNAWKYRDGGVKLCRGGVWEWIQSVYSGGVLLGVLLAGPRRIDPELARKYPVYQSAEPPYELPFRPEERGVPALDAASGEDEWVREGLLQLAARIQVYYERNCAMMLDENKLPRPERLRMLIERMYHNRTCSIGFLAEEIHLSVGRTQHLVKEATGMSFMEFLKDLRLTEAAELLEHSNFQIRQISDYCNFSSPAYFFRAFKARYGTSPERYRKARSGGPPPGGE